MTANPWQFWTAEQIASATGCPVANVKENYPRIVEQLEHAGIADRPVQLAAIATTAIETASTFQPVKEGFFLSEPAATQHRATLRYAPFFGRGYIQLTWESNYKRYGPRVAALWQTSPDQPDFDLVGDPDRALNPDIAAAVLALYFRDHGGTNLELIPKAARRGEWAEVRRLVQGGDAGLDRLLAIVARLDAIPVPEPPPLPPAPKPPTLAEVKAELLAILAPSDQEIVGRVLREQIVKLADRIG